MWSDVVDLRDFYATSLGQVARHLIRRQIRLFWPDLRGRSLIGLGYAAPYLRQFSAEAEQVCALMPAAQGVIHWPAEGPYVSTLVDETELPLQSFSVDRVLMVHCLEHGDPLHSMLEEVWRVLAGDGRLLVVVPNRRGVWARMERTPFASGHPYSQSQLLRLLRQPRFTPQRHAGALFLPPTRSRPLLASAAAWERIGARWFPRLAGAVIVEASKQLYAGTRVHATVRRRRSLALPLPAVPRPTHRDAGEDWV